MDLLINDLMIFYDRHEFCGKVQCRGKFQNNFIIFGSGRATMGYGECR